MRGPAIILALVVAFTGREAFARSALAVRVTETAEDVQLHIVVTDDVLPGSIEVELAGRDVAVVARSTSGEPLRSRRLRLAEPAVEEGARTDYEADGSVTVTLRKARVPGTS